MTAPQGTVDIGDVALEIRPVRIRWVAWGLAVLVFGLFVTGALLVFVESSGFNFRGADQIAMVVLGAILAGCALLFTRPRLRAGAGGVEVRATILTRRLPWSEVVAVSFPDGTQFARLELPDDEYLTVSALQAVDRGHAARGVSALRRLHAQHHPG